MQETAIIVALLVSAGIHYLFSFQRFTLLIARRHGTTPNEVHTIQILLSPTILGLAGWLGTILCIGAAVFLAVAFRWWLGAVYMLYQFALSGFMPLLPLRHHFSNLAQIALTRQHQSLDSQVYATLMLDVIRSGGQHSQYPG